MFRKLSLAITLAVGMALTTSAAHAQGGSPTLAEVIAAGGIRVGDKFFSDFQLQGLFENPLVASFIIVNGTVGGTAEMPLVCLNFDLLAGAADPSGSFTAGLAFKVTADPGCRVDGFSLAIENPAAGLGALAVTESVFTSAGLMAGTPLATGSANLSALETGIIDIDDNAEIFVRKRIDAAGILDIPGVGAGTTIATIEQCFPQDCAVIPEPASMALLATGGLPLLRVLRRRKR